MYYYVLLSYYHRYLLHLVILYILIYHTVCSFLIRLRQLIAIHDRYTEYMPTFIRVLYRCSDFLNIPRNYEFNKKLVSQLDNLQFVSTLLALRMLDAYE